MRTLFLIAIIFGSMLPAVARPFAGVLVWSWISFMNPHRLAYDFPPSLPVVEPIAILTIIGWLLAPKEPKLPKILPLTGILIAFYVWTCLTTAFAIVPDQAMEKFSNFTKIMILAWLMASMLTNKVRIHAAAWIILISVGYFGVKGGIYTILTGGGGRVWGPPGSMLEDNNQLAVALLMVAPLALYLRTTLQKKIYRNAMMGAFVLILISVLGSASRGALLGITAMLLWLIMNSKRKVGLLLFAVAFMGSAWLVMPDSWKSRMMTINAQTNEQTGEEEHDQSAQTRLNMWLYSIRIANEHPVLGGGFNAFFDKDLQNRLLPPDAERDRAVHSIWFEVLGENGYIGLMLFVTLIVMMVTSGLQVKKLTRNRPDLAWCGDMLAMISVGTVGYAAGGTFVNIATLEPFYGLVAVVIGVTVYARKGVRVVEPWQAPQTTFVRPAPALAMPDAPIPLRPRSQ